MNKINKLRITLDRELKFLNEKLVQDFSTTRINNTNVKAWISGIIDIINSKTFISSNIDDIIWFYQNGLKESRTILDFGTGSGYIAYLLSFMAKQVTAYEYKSSWIDQQYLSDEYIDAFKYIQGIIHKIRSSLKFKFYKTIPLKEKSRSFDAIILYAVIEHIDKDVEKKVFEELFRLLKPNGCIYIAKLPRLYSYQEFIARKFNLGSHSNLYTQERISNLLNMYKFKIQKIEQTGLFFNHPNEITNLFFPITRPLERLTRYFPLSFISHDLRLIARKL